MLQSPYGLFFKPITVPESVSHYDDSEEAAEGREKADSKRLRNILEEDELQRDGLIGKFKELRGRLEALEGKYSHTYQRHEKR